MDNDKLKRYVENKMKLLQISLDENNLPDGFYDYSDFYNIGFEDGEIKGAYDALMMVHILMENKDG